MSDPDENCCDALAGEGEPLPAATREFLSQARKCLRELLEPCLD